jgi:hypothetical protein
MVNRGAFFLWWDISSPASGPTACGSSWPSQVPIQIPRLRLDLLTSPYNAVRLRD